MALTDAFEASVRAQPDKAALRFEGTVLTYRELGARVRKLAGALTALGVRRGHHVAMISANHPACIECLLACAQVGAVYEPYNIRLAPPTVKQLLARSGARVAVVSRALYPAMRSALEQSGHPVRVVLVGKPEGAAADGGEAVIARRAAGADGVLEYERLVDEAAPCAKRAFTAPSDAALLLYTSGTTGVPRGVLLSHDALMKRVSIDVRAMAFTQDCVTLCVLPLFHVTFMSAIITLLVGGELVMANSRKEADLLAAIVERGVTHLCLVPFLLRTLAAHVEDAGARVDTLRLIVYGGEPVDEQLLSCCQKLFACGFLQGYGMTETFGAVTMLLPEHHRDVSRLLTAGTPVPGVEVIVVDQDGRACPCGAKGEVVVKTDTLMTGYLQDDERTREVVRDGWYLTGDIGAFDEEGFLTLVDRKSNMVITGGENVYPLEVERCIRALGDDVADVVVVGVPDAYWGESLAAFVVRGDGSSLKASDVVEQCARQLGGYKKPRQVLFVDEIERGSSGKMPKEALDRLVDRLA